ncbi:uracil-DNA glycosylase [Terrarubrum flagellatum]|uniref:uracil-DNA glycosylase n=1 Tax=Terrirubrum flagellatum TaxID=2895980 RepID=UPI00314503B0
MQAAADPRRIAADVLAFYLEAGVEDALDETPHDRFVDANPPPAERPAPEPAVARPVDRAAPASRSLPSRAAPARADALAPIAPDQAVSDARARAASARTLDELRDLMDAFEGCELKKTAYRLVFGDGDPSAKLMFVGEGPGAEEDRQGKPFVGRSGQLLDRMLAAIGLDRTKVYIANVVPWRPPGNRTPTPAEISICKPFITRQIELVNPDVLICIGLPSAQTLLGAREGILKTRGRWMSLRIGERDIKAMATLHPAYLLRQPSQKKLAWRDFKAIRAALR